MFRHVGLLLSAPFEHFDFIIEGFVRLRRSLRKLWPEEAKWKWAFHPEFILTAEFALWVEGQHVPPSRSFVSSDVYLVYSSCHTFSDMRKILQSLRLRRVVAVILLFIVLPPPNELPVMIALLPSLRTRRLVVGSRLLTRPTRLTRLTRATRESRLASPSCLLASCTPTLPLRRPRMWYVWSSL